MSRTQKILFQALVAILVIVAGVVGFKKLKAGKKEIEKQKPEISLPIVRTITVKTAPMQMLITGQGSAKPVQETQLVTQVSGKVIEISSDLVNGGFIKKGDFLLSIEPADYEIAVTLADARVKEADSIYKQAKEESAAAAEEWNRHNPDEEPPPLVLKEPQLAAVRAKLEAERANLKEARLNLARTRLTAPFNARVASENVDIGQFVTPGQALALLHATDAAEIVIPLEDEDLFWFDVPGFTTDAATGAMADVKATIAGKTVTWPGRVVRSEGRIDETSRMHNIVIEVQAPYGSFPPLVAGQFAEVTISGKTVDRATVIPRSALHDNHIVWVVDPESSRLQFRNVDIARTSHKGVVIKDSLKDGEHIVTSPLKTVSDGMKVRLVKNNGENA